MLKSGATFSPCRAYRYELRRIWNPCVAGTALACFIMLNPSTADEVANDPTVERCERRARSWGWDGLIVANLFALRSTDPKALKTHLDSIGPVNDDSILWAAMQSKLVVCAWGIHGKLGGRSAAVLALLRGTGIALHALKVNADGEPAHPLYLPYSLSPVPFGEVLA